MALLNFNFGLANYIEGYCPVSESNYLKEGVISNLACNAMAHVTFCNSPVNTCFAPDNVHL